MFIFSRVGCDAAVTQCLSPNVRLTTPEERDDDLRVRRDQLPAPARGGPARPRLPRLPRRAHPWRRRAPRRDAAGVQAVRRAALRPGPLQGRLRHRDARARHQHAGPHRRHREAHQVERRDPRRHHAGGVHPADRPRRPSRPRRRGARRRAVAAGDEPPRAGRSRLDPHLSAPVVASGRRTTWRSTSCTSSAASGRASCWSSRSRSSRPTRPWSGWPGSCARARTRWPATPRPRPATSATSWSTPAAPADLRRSRRAPRGSGAPTAATRRSSRSRALKPGDVIMVPAGKFSGYAVVIDPGQSRRRTAALRRHRRAAGPPAGADRLPDARRGGGAAEGPQDLQRPQPADAARPGLRAAHRAPTTSRRRPRAGTGAGVPAPRATTEIDEPAPRDEGRTRATQCPEREDHARWAERWFKLDRDATTLRRRIEQRTNTVARQFDRVCEVLTALDYLDGDTVTERGGHLRRLYSDMDLVAAESLRQGLWDGLTASELASALSVLVFEARRPDDASSPRLPGGPVREVVGRDGHACGASSTRSSASTSSTSCASPTSGSPGRPTAGPRATSSTTCSPSPTSRPVTSCAG